MGGTFAPQLTQKTIKVSQFCCVASSEGRPPMCSARFLRLLPREQQNVYREWQWVYLSALDTTVECNDRAVQIHNSDLLLLLKANHISPLATTYVSPTPQSRENWPSTRHMVRGLAGSWAKFHPRVSCGYTALLLKADDRTIFVPNGRGGFARAYSASRTTAWRRVLAAGSLAVNQSNVAVLGCARAGHSRRVWLAPSVIERRLHPGAVRVERVRKWIRSSPSVVGLRSKILSDRDRRFTLVSLFLQPHNNKTWRV